MIDGKPFSVKSDAWSLGVVLWRLLRTDAPVAMDSQNEFKACLKKLRHSLLECYPDSDTIRGLCTVIGGFMRRSAKRRVSIAEACQLACVQQWWPLDLAREDVIVEHSLYQTSVRTGAILHKAAAADE